MTTLTELADGFLFDSFLAALSRLGTTPELVAHWKQGEFHHDYVLRLGRRLEGLEGDVLVVSTNCNAGIKEVLALASPPERWALWSARCPDNEEFAGTCPPVLGRARTVHWFDPCALLARDARSELRPDARRRQRGGGWIPLDSDGEASREDATLRR